MLAAAAACVLGLSLDEGTAAGAVGTHRISGHAVDFHGREHAELTLYRKELDGRLTEVGYTGASKGPQPHGYAFDVPDGTYLLRAADDMGHAETEWYHDAAGPDTATPIVVDGADIVLEDILLQRPRTISGRVTDADGTPLVGQYVRAHRQGVAPSTPGSVIGGKTAADGRFRVAAGRGVFRIEVPISAPYEYAPEWMRDADSAAGAEIVTVQDDTDVGTIVLSSGASISGTVTSTLGTPVPHVFVNAIDANGDPVHGTFTAPDGTYRLTSLIPGLTRLTFEPPRVFSGAQHQVTVARDEQVAGVDILVAPTPAEATTGKDVIGRIVGPEGQPVPGVRVWAYTEEPEESPARSGGAEAMTDASGVLHLRDVAPEYGRAIGTTYRIYFQQSGTEEGIGFQGWYGGATWDEATRVSVTGTRKDLGDIAVPLTGGVSGSVLTEAGIAPYDAYARAYDTQGNLAASAPIWSDGTYRLRELPAGHYLVEFIDLVGRGGGVWWPGFTSRDNAVPVHVSGGQVTGGVDHRYRSSWRPVTGTLVDHDGTPVTYHDLTIYPASGAPGDEVTTDDLGNFEIAVAPGSYYIQLSDGHLEDSY